MVLNGPGQKVDNNSLEFTSLRFIKNEETQCTSFIREGVTVGTVKDTFRNICKFYEG